jgi:hypothetical protein
MAAMSMLIMGGGVWGQILIFAPWDPTKTHGAKIKI